MTKICIFIRSVEKGGAEKQAILLYEYLSQFYKTYLIVYYNCSKEVHPIIKKENLVFLKDNSLRKLIQIFNILKKNKITHIFNYLPINNVFGILIGKLAGVTFLYGGIRGAKYKSRFKMVIMRYLCNNIATGYISNSYSARESYTQYGFSNEKIMVIHNSIKNIEIKKIPHNQIKILSIGRFIEDKDFETSINAISLLLIKNPEIKKDISYKIIGYGKLENEIANLITKYKINDITEIVNNGYIGMSYSDSDILLNTSKFEGMPNVIMEAMNNGLPIVATDAGDTKYLIQDGINGYLCPIGETEYIVEKLYELILNEKLRNEMGKKSREIIDNNFRSEKVFSAYKDIVEHAN